MGQDFSVPSPEPQLPNNTSDNTPSIDSSDSMMQQDPMMGDNNDNANINDDFEEGNDPKNEIQKLAGELSQKLNDYVSQNQNDSDTSKYVLNMISKQAVKNMDDKDKQDCINKIEKDESSDDEEMNGDDETNEMPNNPNDLMQMESVAKKNELNESLTSLVYHFTSLRGGLSIVREDVLYLQSALSSNAEFHGNKKMFFLSTTRQRSNLSGYMKGKSNIVRLELDGDLLNRNFKGKAMDYWGKDFRTDSNFEMEDRLVTDKSEIYPASKYVRRIDVLIDDQNETQIQYCINMYYEGKTFRQKIFFYNDVNEFNKQSERTINEMITDYHQFDKSQKIASDIGKSQDSDLFDGIKYFSYIYLTIEDNAKIGDFIKYIKSYGLERITQNPKYIKQMSNHGWTNINNAIDQLQINISNMSRKPTKQTQMFIKSVSDFMRSHKFKNYRDLYTYAVYKGKGNTSDKDRLFKIDLDTKKTFLTFVGNDNFPRIVFLNPNKENFWDLFNDRDNFIYYLYDAIERNHYREGEGEMDKFWKYLQHLAKNNISVSQMISILSKLGLSDEEMNELIWGKFEYKDLSRGELYDYQTLNKYKGKQDYTKDYDDFDKLFTLNKQTNKPYMRESVNEPMISTDKEDNNKEGKKIPLKFFNGNPFFSNR